MSYPKRGDYQIVNNGELAVIYMEDNVYKKSLSIDRGTMSDDQFLKVVHAIVAEVKSWPA